LKGKSFHEVVTSGLEKMSTMGSAAPAAVAEAPAAK